MNFYLIEGPSNQKLYSEKMVSDRCELVNLKNSHKDLKRHRHVSVEDIEAASVKALGSNYFSSAILSILLHFMASQGEGAIVSLDFLTQQITNPQEELMPALD